MAGKAVFFPPGQRAFVGVETHGAAWPQKCFDDISEVQGIIDAHNEAVDQAAEEADALQQRAIAYGAKDLRPIRQGDHLHWPADSEHVALDSITYHPDDDTFSGWQSGRSVPEWTQR